MAYFHPSVICGERRHACRQRRHISEHRQTVLDHCRFHENHLKGQKGYEYYGRFAENIQSQGVDSAIEFFLNLQVWGDPDQCYDTIVRNAERIGAEAFVGVFSYAGMPADEAERNMRCFADEVMPRLKAVPMSGRTRWAA